VDWLWSLAVADEAFPSRLWAMADLFTPMALRVAATLRLADHVAAGADSVPALVERTGSDPDALGRLVNHLVTIGVLQRSGMDTLALTDLGDQLREGHPGDGRAWLDIEGAVGRADLSALRLLDTVRTGRPAYPLTYGSGFWEDLAAQPALAESFDALMASRLRFEAPEIAVGYDWGALSHVIDVGGGNGTLLAAILSTHPGLRGTLVDLAGPAEAAGRTLADAGVGDRCEIVAGSFFEVLPAGADAYLLSGVLHDWDDVHALQILRRCAEAADTTGRVLVIEEGLLEGAAGSGLRTEMDLRMLAYTGGRKRTLGGFEQLAADAGLRVSAVHRATRYRSVIELRA
jgi:2,7-dihydroxy-5-methyl-1-naphthoate 7-O-methyltransferase